MLRLSSHGETHESPSPYIESTVFLPSLSAILKQKSPTISTVHELGAVAFKLFLNGD